MARTSNAGASKTETPTPTPNGSPVDNAVDPATASRYFDMVANITSVRSNLFQKLFDPRRNIDDECGYPQTEQTAWGATAIDPDFYRNLYDREAIATRVVEVMPRECWQMTPMVYEDEDPDNVTAFEEAWDVLGQQLRGEQCWYQDEEGSPVWEVLRRADILSGIGHFGIILLGLDDGLPLDQPAAGVSTRKPFGGGPLGAGVDTPAAAGTGDGRQPYPYQPDTASSPYGSMDLYGPAKYPAERTGHSPGSAAAANAYHDHDHGAFHDEDRSLTSPVGNATLPAPPPGAAYFDLTSNTWSVPGKERTSRPVYHLDPKTGLPRLERWEPYATDLSLNSLQAEAVANGMPVGDVMDEYTASAIDNAHASVVPMGHGPADLHPGFVRTTPLPDDAGDHGPDDHGSRGLPHGQGGSHGDQGPHGNGTTANTGTPISPREPTGAGPTANAPGDAYTPPNPYGDAPGGFWQSPVPAYGAAIGQGAALGTDAQYLSPQLSPPVAPKPLPAGTLRKLLFVRAFDEALVQIVQYEANPLNPRYGQPIMYRVTLNDPRELHSGVGLPMATIRVHWSRIIHLADNHHTAGSSVVFAAPRMRPVLNRLLDLRKLYSGSAEGYWRSGCMPMTVFSTVPQLGGDVRIDLGSIRDMMEQAENGLQRWIALMGMSASQLAPQIVDPGGQIQVQLEAICIKIGCPVRVFKGSERGELASSQDDSAWNDRLRERNLGYTTPKIVVPFIDRLISLGVLPEPGKGKAAPTKERKWLPKAQAAAGAEGAPGAEGGPGGGPGGGKGSEGGPGGGPLGAEGVGIGATEGASTPAGNRRAQARHTVAPNVYGPDGRGRYRTVTSFGRVLILNAAGKPVGVQTKGGYSIEWPSLDSLGEKDKAAVALQATQAIGAYVSGNVESMMTPMDFYTRILRMDEEEARSIIDNITAAHEEEETMTMPAQIGGRPAAPQEGTQAFEDRARRDAQAQAQQAEGARRFDRTAGLKEKSLDKGLAAFGGGGGGGEGGGGGAGEGGAATATTPKGGAAPWGRAPNFGKPAPPGMEPEEEPATNERPSTTTEDLLANEMRRAMR